ncbi:MAG: hypothetical protein MAG451_01929 [Anaerolineales bacterium]|nr:hypothetical protein [Anaerolineales bacterium]
MARLVIRPCLPIVTQSPPKCKCSSPWSAILIMAASMLSSGRIEACWPHKKHTSIRLPTQHASYAASTQFRAIIRIAAPWLTRSWYAEYNLHQVRERVNMDEVHPTSSELPCNCSGYCPATARLLPSQLRNAEKRGWWGAAAPHRPLFPVSSCVGTKRLSSHIAVMKLGAVAGRGSKKDFAERLLATSQQTLKEGRR